MATKQTYTVTFSDGSTMQRHTSLLMTHAWRVCVLSKSDPPSVSRGFSLSLDYALRSASECARIAVRQCLGRRDGYDARVSFEIAPAEVTP